jgi:hypothetical protein
VIFAVIALLAAAVSIYVGPPLLVIAFLGWLFGAPWAAEVAMAGAVCTVVGIFFRAMED